MVILSLDAEAVITLDPHVQHHEQLNFALAIHYELTTRETDDEPLTARKSNGEFFDVSVTLNPSASRRRVAAVCRRS